MRQYRILLVIAALLVVGWLIWTARGALFPFMLGLVVAYLLMPLVTRIQRIIPDRGWLGRHQRTLAVTTTYLIAILLLVGAAATIIPPAVRETSELIDSLPDLVDDVREEYGHWQDRYEEDVPEDIRDRIESYLDEIGSILGDIGLAALSTTFGTVRKVFGFLAGVVLLPLWLFYVLKDERKAFAFFYDLWPAGIRQDVRNIVGIADRILAAYVRGQLILGFVVGIVTFVGLYVIDLQFAVGLAILSGIFELVPILGPWISFIVAAIVVLATEPEKIWLVAILFLMVQQLENTFLVPKIQGDAVGMNPAVIMVLLVVGGAVFGLLGVIAIVPLAAIARDIFIYVYQRLSDEGALPETPL
jgi:predicted PurR-regulated permease PerM